MPCSNADSTKSGHLCICAPILAWGSLVSYSFSCRVHRRIKKKSHFEGSTRKVPEGWRNAGWPAHTPATDGICLCRYGGNAIPTHQPTLFFSAPLSKPQNPQSVQKCRRYYSYVFHVGVSPCTPTAQESEMCASGKPVPERRRTTPGCLCGGDCRLEDLLRLAHPTNLQIRNLNRSIQRFGHTHVTVTPSAVPGGRGRCRAGKCWSRWAGRR